MGKYDYIREKAREVVDMLKAEVSIANEDDLFELQYIAEEMCVNIPRDLMIVDYMPRSAVDAFIKREEEAETIPEYMTTFIMKTVWDNTNSSFFDEDRFWEMTSNAIYEYDYNEE